VPREFYARPTVAVAQDLLGLVLRHATLEGTAAGRIVEVEAYLGLDDPASHAYRGPTPRARVMFGPPGHAYVYVSYGVHACMNVVCETPGVAGAVLIRALEPVAGLALMRRRRGVADPRALCSGPGKLTQALGVTLALNEADLVRPPLTIGRFRGARAPAAIAAGPRVGITAARDWPLRFFEAGSPFVSRGGGRGEATGRGGPSRRPRA
jgi:DNA-3-methyladenine glycosylase